MRIAVIPARKNSKRILNKNIKIFKGFPLIYWSIKAAKDSKVFDKIFVSTNCKKISELSMRYGAEVPFLRSNSMAGDHLGVIEVVKDFIEKIEKGQELSDICMISAVSPNMDPIFIKKALTMMRKFDCDFVFSACKYHSPPQRSFLINKGFINMIDVKKYNTRSQDLPELYHDAGQFYWAKKEIWKKKKKIFTKNSIAQLVPSLTYSDINNKEDFKNASILRETLNIKDEKVNQTKIWEGPFGNKYTKRHNSKPINSEISFFKKIFKSVDRLTSILELGCNNGRNLEALRKIDVKFELKGYEINEIAIKEAQKKKFDVSKKSISSNLQNSKSYDLVFTKGVLIHIPPNKLDRVYTNMYNLSKKYLLVAEYFNPTPMKLIYRGNKNLMFKRDFAKDLIDKFNLNLVDYGFVYKYDPINPQDNLNWFLLRK